tara:strand:+ start:1562 stop:1930 length:369 start_codon:yes stop_codon:yes gene_type:complete
MDENKSDWNQQQDFSSIYFEIGKFCRLYQQQGNLERWYSFFISKISHCAGIFKEEEFNDVMQMVQEVTAARDDIYSSKEKEKLRFERFLANGLFLNEAKLDRMVNDKMPFLNIRRKSDIEGF